MATVFVTGANGFIGSHLVDRLLSRGDEVVGLVRRTSDLRRLEPAQAAHGGGRLRLVTGDLNDPMSYAGALDRVEYVYHLAGVLYAIREADYFMVNREGTRRLCETLLPRSSALRRVLLTSSQAAVGPGPGDRPLDETAPYRPVSWYGRSKQALEELAREFAERGLPVTIARPPAVYGERDEAFSGNTFPAVRLGLAPRLGRGRQMVSIIHVEDLVTGLIAAAENPAGLGKTYFFTDGPPHDAREVIRAIADAMGRRVRIPVTVPVGLVRLGALLSEWRRRLRPRALLLPRDKVRELRHRNWGVTSAAARAELGWSPAVDLAGGMRRAVADWRTRARLRRAGPSRTARRSG